MTALDSRPATAPTTSWWREASGAVADLGVLVPIAIALIVSNGLSTTAVLLPAGLLYLVVAWTYRTPVAVQPLKAFGAAAIAAGAGADVIAAGSLIMGVVFLALGSSGLLDRLGATFPRVVIRGVQLAVGLTFARIAWGMLTSPSSTFTAQWPPALTALVCLVTTVALLRWRRASALIAVVLGLGVAVIATWGAGAVTLGPTPIVLPTISTADLLLAATLLVLPQVPLTLANSCLAPADAAPKYFPDSAARITPSRLARTLGAANLAVGAIGGMPLCHGAGGMSAHHAFGARTWRAPALIGAVLTALALLLGNDLALVLRAFPLAVLAALLLVAGITHVRLLTDLRGWSDWSLALLVGIAGAAGYLLAAVVGGLVVVALRSWLRARRSSEAVPTPPGTPRAG
ncbi:MAG TPA: molybdate transporter family protein [Motilibacterales bacterium]|nr:molybdate transporter family protein [Motilibacterales bacterium]